MEVSGLTSGYGRNVVIEDVTFDLRDRDYLAVIGPNGGGKTTLFRTILGLMPPTRGTVSIYGEPPVAGVRRIGYVPQRAGFDHSYPATVRDTVLMGLRARKGMRPTYSAEDRIAAAEAMSVAEVSELADRKVGDLSGGQIQRVLLARALASDPDILMLDEPTSSLDPEMVHCVHGILKDVNRKAAILMITHDIESMGGDVKRIACLNRRMVVSDSSRLTPEMLSLGFCCPPDMLSKMVCGCRGEL